MDNCGIHSTDISGCRGQISTICLPPNCTSVHQQMDLGSIENWKKIYRKKLWKCIVNNLECSKKPRDESSSLKAGMKGLSEGFDPHILDVCVIDEERWAPVTQETDVSCRIKANVLSLGMNNSLSLECGKFKVSSPIDNVEDFFGQLQNLSLHVHRSDVYHDVVRM